MLNCECLSFLSNSSRLGISQSISQLFSSHTHKADREALEKLDEATHDLKQLDRELLDNKRTNDVLHGIFSYKIATVLPHL